MPLIDAHLKEALVCPSPHHAALIEDEAAGLLRCSECGLGFEEAVRPEGTNQTEAPADNAA
jgi:transcription initiation factor TFIIIB Brf1 subunit/transcription initiation factor TFIIB